MLNHKIFIKFKKILNRIIILWMMKNSKYSKQYYIKLYNFEHNTTYIHLKYTKKKKKRNIDFK